MKSSEKLLTICCVLRSGGDYKPIYVEKLHTQILNVIKSPFRFLCFTDYTRIIGGIPLEFRYPGWWSKLEIFKLTGPVIYFDLDTIIISDFESLISNVMREKDKFYMLKEFNPRRTFASGIMAWNGNFSHILNEYENNKTIKDWDQFYIIEKVGKKEIIPIDSIQKGIYSYKIHCREKLLSNASIICFHGKPRPHEVKTGWVLDYWKENINV